MELCEPVCDEGVVVAVDDDNDDDEEEDNDGGGGDGDDLDGEGVDVVEGEFRSFRRFINVAGEGKGLEGKTSVID